MKNLFEKIFSESERPLASMFIRSTNDIDCLRTYNALLDKNINIVGTQAELRVLNQKIKDLRKKYESRTR